MTSPAASRREAFMAASGLTIPKNALFHGTSPENADAIMREGFRLDAPQRHGRASGEGVYLHHDPLVAAQHGSAIVVAKRGGGPLADWHQMTYKGWSTRSEEEQASYRRENGHPGFKDPDDKSTVITDPGVLKPLATSHSGQCPTCFGNGYHDRTGQTCSTCSGKGVMW
jgi:hypothetical protein